VGTIVIHAGMPKAGSSTVQRWLVVNARRLQREHGVTLAVARGADPLLVSEFDGSESINSQALVLTMKRGADARAGALTEFFSGLEGLGERNSLVLLTSETFADALWRPDEDFIEGLDDLASRHRVRISYYVRPQHTAMEAAWRQWGFRYGGPPSRYLARRVKQLHYASIYKQVRSFAPRVDFVPRPFRNDLLDAGDILVDFARHYLGLEVAPGDAPPVNRGLPLELVNLLRAAPERSFWSSAHDNATLQQIKRLFQNVQLPESDQVRRSRQVLQSVCHETFEPGNRELIRELGWATTEFVPAPVEPISGGLKLLDELWVPSASAAELNVLFCAIGQALDSRRR
jgi:hypothetical protein